MNRPVRTPTATHRHMASGRLYKAGKTKHVGPGKARVLSEESFANNGKRYWLTSSYPNEMLNDTRYFQKL